jgi:hypothetical protein
MTQTRVAWVLAVVSAVLGLAVIPFAVLNGTSLAAFVLDFAALGPLVGVALPVLGALILRRYPRHPIGWVLIVTGLLQAVSQLAFQSVVYDRANGRVGAATFVAYWVTEWAWLPSTVFAPLLLTLVPDGHPRGFGRLVAWLTVGWAVLAVLANGVAAWPLREERTLAFFAGQFLPSPGPLTALVGDAVFPVAGVLSLLSYVALYTRMRRARGEERQQVRWVAVGSAPALIELVFQPFVPLLQTGLGSLISLAPMIMCVAVAVFRYRLYDLGRLLNRALVYALVTATLAAVYVAGVLGVGRLFTAGRPSDATVAAVTLLCAVLFRPLRTAVQEQVDRRFNRRRYDAERVVQEFAGRLRQQVDLDTLSAEVLEAVDRTLQPNRAQLWLIPRQAEGR